MKKFLSIILAVVMIASLLPATFVSAAEGDIVFNFADHFTANPGIVRHTDFTASPFEGLTQNVSGTAANAGVIWETSGNTLRWNNTQTDWQTASYSAGNANANNKIAFDYNVPTAGWYRFSMPFSSNSTATTTVAVYDIFNNVPSFMGEVKYNTTSDAVYLEAGTHTILLCCVYSGNGSTDAIFIQNFTFTKVDAPTGSVELADFPTAAIGIGSEVEGTAVVNTNYGAKQFSGFGVKLSAANVKYRVETAGDTSNYIKVTYSNPGVAEVTVTPNTAVGAKGSVPYSITGVAEGTTDVTFTPVVGGVEQTALATTETISVMDVNFNFDFATQAAKYERHTLITEETTLPYFGIADGMSEVIKWDKGAGGMRFYNIAGTWTSENAARNHPTLKVTVPAEKAGYAYDLYFKYNANAGETGPFSVYHISNGKATYLGDLKTGAEPNFRPVVLTEGDNYFAFCAVGTVTVSFIPSMKLTRVGSVPTAESFTAEMPTSVALNDTSATYTATVAMSNGKNYQFPQYAINTAGFTKASGTPDSYIKFDISPADVLSVTSANGGVDNRDKTTYSFAGLKEGTATVTMTPVIAGVEQTALAKTQTVSVIDENIIYDFAAWYTANSFERFTLVTDETAPAGFGIADGMSDVLQWDATSLRVCGVSDTWGSDKPVEDRAVGSRFAMTIDVPAGKAGWYTPQLNYTGNTGEEGLCSIYHIYNGEATYLGDTVNGGDNYLAPVYLEAGENIIAGGVVRGTTGMFIKKLAFTKYEGEQATLSSITVADPADLTVGEQSARYEITGAMSDGSAMKFPPLGMDTETFHNSGLNTTDYIKVTATPANVVDVLAYSGSYEGMTNYYYEVKAVSEGDVVLSFVPVVDGVEKDDLKVTKNISVTHPDGNITGDSVSIWYSATDVAGAIDAEAKGLLDGNIAAGEVNNVAVGTEVTVTAEDSEELTFLYWYNGNSKRVLSDDAEYTFTAGTNTSVYAKYIAKGEEATEYFNASGALIEEAEGTFAAEPDVELGGYKLFKDTAAAVAEIATATAESADFVCWTKDGKAVSYNTTYTYAKWGNVGEAVEVTEGEKSSAPAVVLFQNGNAYMLELVNFEGKTIIEKGIAFNGDIDSCTSKAVSADKNVKQFTATGDGEAVAYVIYRDGAAVRVAYSD
ncbi:MAG: hypothetical protein IKM21_00225 [Oscillospiraceae bacterium]|nr:hypothetical protein [Oscillospiraceae bacterium]